MSGPGGAPGPGPAGPEPVPQGPWDSERRFRDLADTAPAMLWIGESDRSCSFRSRGWYEFTGQTEVEALGEGWIDALHPEDRAETERVLREAHERRTPFRVDYRVRRADGEYRWAVDDARPRLDRDGRFLGFVGSVMDVGDRRRAEGHSRLLFEAATVLLAAADPDAMLRELFEKLSESLEVDVYFNYMVEPAGAALRLASSAGVTEEQAAALRRLALGQGLCGSAALERRPVVAHEVQRSPDPRTALARELGLRAYACHPLVADGELLGTLAFASRRKDRFDEDELALVETLAHHVTVAYERLRLVERLREADRRKDEFLAMLAHELRNPIAPMRYALHLLEARLARGEDPRHFVQIISRQTDTLARLVDDLLDVSRITRGHVELRREAVDLREVVARAVEAARAHSDPKRQELRAELPDDRIVVLGDPMRLEQVLGNLLVNAIRYTGAGGRIEVRAAPSGDLAEVCVRDDGVGLEPESFERVFDLFHQSARSLDRAQGGLGIGLTVAKRLVELHGGTIEARSDGPGRGSEFRFRVPLLRGEALPAQPSADAPRIFASVRRVLVVDDNPDNAEGLAELLREHEVEVHVGRDGEDALRLVAELGADLVLLDVGLPGLDGYEVARRLRADPAGAGLTLVALTGYGQPADRQASLAAGFDHHFVKPLPLAELERLLARRPPPPPPPV